ncbi:MAG: ANTAR domain-containing protein [Ruminococcus sp.]|nr:ANTAR domain-containing protein [Ruminococcus sp.]
MLLKQRRYSVLIVSSQPKFNQALTELISSRRNYDSELETNVSGAKRRLLERSFDMLIINVPLPDDDGISLAIDRSAGMASAVLLLVKSEYYSDVFDRVCPHGVYTLPKPSPKQMVAQAFDWLESTKERLRRLEKKSVSLEDKMQEIRLVNRAKWLLISEKGMTEDDAHRYIEKLAMDKCITKHDAAQQIISQYEKASQ